MISFSNPVSVDDALQVLGLRLDDVVLSLNVAREVTVVSVVDVFSGSVDSRDVILIELVVSLVHVVLNTVSVAVINSVLSALPLDESNVIEVLGSIDLLNKFAKLSLHERRLGILAPSNVAGNLAVVRVVDVFNRS